jgi:hypothetical protein
VIWHKGDGHVPRPEDWHDANFRLIALELRGDDPLYIVLNGGDACPITLPDGDWALILDTTRPDILYEPISKTAPAQSVLVFQPRKL